MNQIETLCESLLGIAALLIPERECEVFTARIRRYRRIGARAAAPLHGHVGRLLGLARSWSNDLKRYNLLEGEATLQKVLKLREGLRNGLIETLELSVMWFQAERRR